MSFVVERKEALYAKDVQQALSPARKEKADEAFAALDENVNSDIILDDMIIKVVEISRDRKAISASMRDVGQAIGVFDQILVVVLLIVNFWYVECLSLVDHTNIGQLPSKTPTL
jgi:hypothetical protein